MPTLVSRIQRWPSSPPTLGARYFPMCHTGVEFSDSTLDIFTPDAGRHQSLLGGLLPVAVRAERL